MSGRIGRGEFWAFAAGFAVIGALLLWLVDIEPAGFAGAAVVSAVVPRLHDLGRTGWWAALPLGCAAIVLILGSLWIVPRPVVLAAFVVLGSAFLAWLVVLGILPGQPGRNRFGPPPRSGY
ncbi:DUF805 domain-containing protein [Sphingomonas sp. CJ20]